MGQKLAFRLVTQAHSMGYEKDGCSPSGHDNLFRKDGTRIHFVLQRVIAASYGVNVYMYFLKEALKQCEFHDVWLRPDLQEKGEEGLRRD